MDALAGSSSSSLKLLSRACRQGARSSSTLIASSKTAIHFSVFRNVSGESLCLRSLRSVPISVSAQTKDGAESVDTQAAYQSTTTVHVRFLLQKECMFGEHFCLVGEDPVLGFWDPLAAIPMQWSDGHIWKTEMDIPAGTTIQFKFILKSLTEEIEWQPGPDRILQTWETKNTIVISEDWYSPELQKITEESVVTPSEESSIAEIVGSNGRPETDEEVVIISDQSPVVSEDLLSLETPVSPEHPLSFTGPWSPEGPILIPGLSSPSAMLATDEAVLKETPNEKVEAQSSISVDPVTAVLKETPNVQVEAESSISVDPVTAVLKETPDVQVEAQSSISVDPVAAVLKETPNVQVEAQSSIFVDLVTAASPADEAADHNIPESKNQFYGTQEPPKPIRNQHEEEIVTECDEPEEKHVPAEVVESPAPTVLRNDLDWGLRTLTKLIQSLGF